jgi:hypothetical protein
MIDRQIFISSKRLYGLTTQTSDHSVTFIHSPQFPTTHLQRQDDLSNSTNCTDITDNNVTAKRNAIISIFSVDIQSHF